MSDLKPFAFVLMPFDPKFSDIYRLGIKHVADENGVVAERVDEQHFSEPMLERIYRQIDNADFVIAEMTGKNPNVFYEVGYAHAKAKLCALITQSAADIPFDLKHHHHIVYDGSIQDLREKLAPRVKWLVEQIESARVQTLKLTIRADSASLEKTSTEHIGTFDLVLDLKNHADRRSPEIEAIYIRTGPAWQLSMDGKPCPTERLDDGTGIRSQITPRLNRLLPGAFSQQIVSFRRVFWSKFSGEKAKEEYSANGNLTVTVATTEGAFKYELPLKVEFTEFPF